MERLVVVGQGYVGLPLAVLASERGFNTTGFELDQHVVNSLNEGISHIDDVSNAEIVAALKRGYSATDDESCLDEADVIVVCVPTPLGLDGGPDLGAVERAGRCVGRHVRSGALVVLESTSYPGTTAEIFAPLVLGDSRTLDHDVFVAFSPERVDPGNAVYCVANTPKVVGGLTEASTRAAVDFYGRLVERVVPAAGAREAELAKLIENTFRHVNIALMNEMARFSHDLGIDLWNAIDCAATKPFGYMAFKPGPGVGGHCIPIDPTYLSHQVRARLGYAFRMVELAEEINSAAPHYVASRVQELLNSQSRAVQGSTVLLLGVTYKPDIADTRESPAFPLATRLRQLGAQLVFHDPYVLASGLGERDQDRYTCVGDPYVESSIADVTVLLQPHCAYDLVRLGSSARCILDTRGVMAIASNVSRL